MKEIKIKCFADGRTDYVIDELSFAGENLATKIIVDFTEVTNPDWYKWVDIKLANRQTQRYFLDNEQIVSQDLTKDETIAGIMHIAPFITEDIEGETSKISYSDVEVILRKQADANINVVIPSEDVIIAVVKQMKNKIFEELIVEIDKIIVDVEYNNETQEIKFIFYDETTKEFIIDTPPEGVEDISYNEETGELSITFFEYDQVKFNLLNNLVQKITSGEIAAGKALKDSAGNDIGETYETKTDATIHKTNTTNPHQVTVEQIGAAESNHNHDGAYEPNDINIQAHIINENNPHSVSKEQIGAAAVNHNHYTDYEPKNVNIQSHIVNNNNPHQVTYEQTGASPNNHKHDEDYEAKNTNIQIHISDKNNPHQVTVEQIGAAAVNHDHTGQYEPYNEEIWNHIGTVSGNPHEVTAAEVGADTPLGVNSKIATHNSDAGTHVDIRSLIWQGHTVFDGKLFLSVTPSNAIPLGTTGRQITVKNKAGTSISRLECTFRTSNSSVATVSAYGTITVSSTGQAVIIVEHPTYGVGEISIVVY